MDSLASRLESIPERLQCLASGFPPVVQPFGPFPPNRCHESIHFLPFGGGNLEQSVSRLLELIRVAVQIPVNKGAGAGYGGLSMFEIRVVKSQHHS